MTIAKLKSVALNREEEIEEEFDAEKEPAEETEELESPEKEEKIFTGDDENIEY